MKNFLVRTCLSKHIIDQLTNIVINYLKNEYIAVLDIGVVDGCAWLKTFFINYTINKEEIKVLKSYIDHLKPDVDTDSYSGFFLDMKVVDEDFVDQQLSFNLFSQITKYHKSNKKIILNKGCRNPEDKYELSDIITIFLDKLEGAGDGIFLWNFKLDFLKEKEEEE